MKKSRALVLPCTLLALLLGACPVWAGPDPLPLSPPFGTEAFVSKDVLTQLRAVEDPGTPPGSGLSFQFINGAAGIEYNNIAYDPGSPQRGGGYIYAIQIFGEGTAGGNKGLLRIGQNTSGNIFIQPLGWPGYFASRTCETYNVPTGSTDSRMCGTGQYYPRYDAGDIDTGTGQFQVLTQGQVLANTGNTCGTNPSACTDRVRSFDLDIVWALVPPGAAPADLSPAYGVSRIFRNPATDSLYGATSEEAAARIADWAYRDGKLYGGDGASGKLAVITAQAGDDDADPSNDATPAYFELFPFDPTGIAPSLDSTIAFNADAYGAAWFIDDILYLYRNGGGDGTPKVFKVDLQIGAVTPGVPYPKIIEIVTAVDRVTRNDGASFGVGPTAFDCTDGPFVIQGDDDGNAPEAFLARVNPSNGTFSLDRIPNNTSDYPYRLNNLGYRSTDGLLYGWLIPPGPNGGEIVRMDNQFNVTLLGRPLTMPASNPAANLNSGDVTPDGTTMYLSNSAQNGFPLWTVDLTAPILDSCATCATSQAISGDGGRVNDVAVHPVNGYLYGCDQVGSGGVGQLAILNPADAVRTDVLVPGLPGGATNTTGPRYGAAWFGANEHLFCYENGGTIYEIDLQLGGGATDATPVINGTRTGPNSTDNDGANCVEGVTGEPSIVKTLSGDALIGIYRDYATPYTFTITYTNTPQGFPVIITDTVRAEFEITDAFLVPSAGTASFSQTLAGSATDIAWALPTGTDCSAGCTLEVNIETVVSPGKGHGKKAQTVYKPTSCGPLPINDGATAFVDGGVVGTYEPLLDVEVVAGPSNPLEVTAVGKPEANATKSCEVPTAVTGLTVEPGGSGELVLDWDDNGDAALTGYNIYQDGEFLTSVGVSPSGYTVTALTSGTKYCYEVKAVNPVGESEDTKRKKHLQECATAP